MITHSGRRIDLPSPQRGQVHIGDVAVQLSRIPRFVGATLEPWNVAAHSLHCSALAEADGASLQAQLAALLHDAHEAYMGDIPSPFKQAVMAEAGSMWCPLKLAEEKLQVAVLHQLGSLDCYEANRAEVKHWDLVSLATERKYLMHAAAMDAPWPMLTDDAEPTRLHPRQHQLDLRDVSAQARGGVVDQASNPEFNQPDADGVITFKAVTP